jgi:nicotinamidase-related amidase
VLSYRPTSFFEDEGNVFKVRSNNASDTTIPGFPEGVTLYLKSIQVGDALLKSLSDFIATPTFKAQRLGTGGFAEVTIQISGMTCYTDNFGFVSLAGNHYFIYVKHDGSENSLAGKLWAIKSVMKIVSSPEGAAVLHFPAKVDVGCPESSLMYPGPKLASAVNPQADNFAWRHAGELGAGDHGAFVYKTKAGCFRLDLDGKGTMPCAERAPFRDMYTGPPKKKKRVLVVIDVQGGYDAAIVANASGPGGLAYLNDKHDVNESYALGAWNANHTMKQVTKFEPGTKQISYNKGWNTGLPSAVIEPVVNRVNELVETVDWDLVLYTHDYLDPEAKGVFPLDDKPWSDPNKEIALVPYAEFLTIAANGSGTDTHDRFMHNPHCAKHGPGIFKVGARKVMCFRKQVDDAFADDMAERGPKTVDPDGNGRQNPFGHLLLTQLTEAGYGPENAQLSFTGVVTSRCVQSSLVHACNVGYKTELIKGACADASDSDHTKGVEAVRSGCPSAKISE